MNESVLERLGRDIREQDIAANRHNYQRFHKEKLKEPVGLSAAVLRKISNHRFRELRGQPSTNILALCDSLLASGKRYMQFFAFDWAEKLKGHYARSDFKRFHSWLVTYVNDWGSCDHLCGGPLGHLIYQYPDLAVRTQSWARSRNRWHRRAAAVCLIVPARNGQLNDRVFAVADRLLNDEDDLVQKGCGWMLKEAAGCYQQKVFRYVMDNRSRMARTTLRYAIEKMPATLRRKAMEKPE
jgi:3-methyladenine DNA glycosylase AlkD